MKKSSAVKLGLLAAISAFALGCDDTQPAQVKRCIDKDNKMVDDSGCDMADQRRVTYVYTPGTPYPDWWYYHYVYGGSGGYAPGSVVYGYHATPEPNVAVITASEAARGGFGGAGRVSVPAARGGFGGIGSGHGVGE